jgi:tetratricopeptide (TPR) repeat protein
MLTEDYLMRMINLALAAILRAAGLKVAGQYQQGLQMLDQALEGLFGMRADLLKRLEDEVLLQRLTEQGKLDPDLLLVAADIFKEEGEILRLQGHLSEAVDSFQRALTFALEAGFLLQDSRPAQVLDKVDSLLQALKDVPLSVDTRYALFCFFDEYGSYAQASQVITGLYQDPQAREQIRSEYFAFLQKLLAKPDSELAASGLTHEMIEAKLKDDSV